VERLESRVTPAMIAVTGTGDTIAVDGVVTLREAITSVNGGADVNADVVASGAYGTADTINFAIPGAGVQTINVLTTALPQIVKTLTLDGFSQPGAAFGTPLIVLNGASAGAGASGLVLSGVSGCLVRGLVINNFLSLNGEGVGIQIDGGSNNRVQGNVIGTDAGGTVALANGRGVVIQSGASGNIVGTDGDGAGDAAEANLISGSNTYGVDITGAGTAGNRVSGNKIGTDAAGTAALANSGGVVIQSGASGNIVGTDGDGSGDAAEANLISGNRSVGVLITDAGTAGNRVSGNKIGTDAAGAAAIANLDGVLIQSGARGNIVGTDGDGSGDAAEANLISGNARFGVNIREDSTDGNRVSGNRIGTDFNGTADLGNTLDGVLISLGATGNTIGGTAAGAGNVIAFNAKGVVVGTDAADGAAGNTITRNRIFANAGPGIDLGDDDVTPNDAADPDPGPNLLQNFPVLTAATSTTVGGTLNSTPGRTFVLEFFAGGAAAGQGQTFLGSTTVTTDATTGTPPSPPRWVPRYRRTSSSRPRPRTRRPATPRSSPRASAPRPTWR
jgi:titin